MKRTLSLAAGALTASLLLGGPGGGTTMAAWRDEVTLDAATVISGNLDVSVADVAAPPVASRAYRATFEYVVSAHVVGDNLVSHLRIGFDQAPMEYPSEVAVAAFIGIETGSGPLVVDASGGEVLVAVTPHASTWGGVGGEPVLRADEDGRVSVPVTFTVMQVDRAVARFTFPGGDLLVSLDQVRPDAATTESSPGRWSAADTATVPSIGTSSYSVPAAGEDVGGFVAETTEPSAPSTSSDDLDAELEPEPDAEPELKPEPDAEPEPEPGPDEAVAVDPDVLPAEVEEWAKENEVSLDEIVAWRERRQG